MDKKKFWFIVNPISGKAGRAKQIMALIHQKLSSAPQVEYSIKITERAGEGCEIARRAAQEEIDIVVAVGGDGTMNEVGRALLHSDTALGLIPSGSGNGFARSMKIPLRADWALDVLLNSAVTQVDVGQINERYFLGVAGVGFDAHIGAKFQEFGKRGALPYFYIGVKEYFSYPYEEFKIMAGAESRTVRPLLITIANTSQYGNGAVIAPGADNQDGLLDVCIVDRTPLWQGVFKIGRLFNNKIDTVPFYSSFRAREISIVREANNGLFHTDGEPHLGGKELRIKVIAGALKVCIPAPVV